MVRPSSFDHAKHGQVAVGSETPKTPNPEAKEVCPAAEQNVQPQNKNEVTTILEQETCQIFVQDRASLISQKEFNFYGVDLSANDRRCLPWIFLSPADRR